MLKKSDKILYDLIKKETQRQNREIELIASENYVSRDVLEAIGSVLTNKYSEGYPGKRYYAGQKFIDQIEQLAIDRAKEIFGAEYVNVQPLSGSIANLAVYLGLLKPGDKILGLSLDQGGHLSHGHSLNFSGLFYTIIPYTLDKKTEVINMDEVEKLALKHKPRMILAGFSAYPRDIDWVRFRQIADKTGALLMADISHIAGLVAGGVLKNPVPYCDVVTTTTHKTLRGPRGAIIMSRKEFASAIAKAVFPGIQGGPHENLIAAKAVAFKEALSLDFKIYAKQVLNNAKVLASELIHNGFRIITNGTDNHIILIDVFSSFGLTGKEAEKSLELIGLSTNKNLIPYDSRKSFDPSGIRIGTPAVTTRGMKEDEMKKIARIFSDAIKITAEVKGYRSNVEDSSNMDIFKNSKLKQEFKKLREEVLELCKKFPVYR